MTWKTNATLAAFATAAILAIPHGHAELSTTVPVDPRPTNSVENLPSDTGAQTTLPSGAVAGAGQPQGTLPQPDDGAPGGVEQRARRERSDGADVGFGSPRGPDGWGPRLSRRKNLP
jgi:hypothetical protein